jgi:hypothetical protein
VAEEMPPLAAIDFSVSPEIGWVFRFMFESAFRILML